MAHTTRYGNTYSDRIWGEMQEAFAEEEQEDKEYFAKIAGMEKYLRRQLGAFLTSQKAIDLLVKDFRMCDYDEKRDDYQIAKPIKTKVDDLWERWMDAMPNG